MIVTYRLLAPITAIDGQRGDVLVVEPSGCYLTRRLSGDWLGVCHLSTPLPIALPDSRLAVLDAIPNRRRTKRAPLAVVRGGME